MSGSTGYSLDQLLEWCKQDHLIDGFRKDSEAVLIWHDGAERILSHTDARLYLTRMFTGIRLRSDDETTENRNTA